MNITHWIGGVVSFAMGGIVLPTVRVAADRWQLYDPCSPLKIHTRPISRLGGVAILPALLGGTLVAGEQPLRGFYAAVVLVWIIGIVDDVRRVSPGFRLLVEAAAATLLWQTGLRIPTLPGLLGFMVVVLFVLLMVNAFNMLDGADGLAAGVAAVIAAGYIFLTVIGGTTTASAVLSWSLLGCCLNFLIFNFPPATMFMGDSGSTVLGLVIAYLGLDFYCGSKVRGNHLLLPLLFAGLPLLDAIVAALRRLRRSASPFRGDRRHFYDLLLERRWSPTRVALCSYAVTGVLVAMGLLSDQVPSTVSFPLSIVLTASLLFAAVRLGALRSGPDARSSRTQESSV